MAEIKIRELSVGDWVKVDDCDKFLIQRVVAIDATRREIGIIKNNKGGIYWYYEDEIEPIPLTPEILEKNGFEEVEPQWYMCELNGIHISVIVWENQRGRLEISYKSPFDDDNPLYIADFTANITHFAVHHLQRALRLAGVEKEIEV